MLKLAPAAILTAMKMPKRFRGKDEAESLRFEQMTVY